MASDSMTLVAPQTSLALRDPWALVPSLGNLDAYISATNRLPMLMLCGDTFLTRLPDPVLQQLEHFGNPTFGVNDAFKAVSRFWDRITHPAQILQSLPAALATMLDPADCGPAFIGRA